MEANDQHEQLTGFSWMFSVSRLDWASVELDGTTD